MKLVCCCLSQVINNLFHLITTLRCSNIDQDSQPDTHTPNPPNAPTHTHQGKEEKRKGENRERGKGEEGKGNPHHTTPTHNPSSYHEPQRYHTQRERGKRERERGVPLCVVLIRCVV